MRVRGALTAAEWRRAALLAAAVLTLHVAGFLLLLANGSALGVGVGITAYTLGLRHAFDADHIAAIDNVTRKLMGEGRRPLGVGFSFSLGHSTVVFALGLLVVVGVRGLGGAVQDDGSTLHRTTGVLGPLVSGTFLVSVGVANLAILANVVRRLRAGHADDDAPAPGGLLTRLYGRFTAAVSRSWHMYPLGILFGLGFDTASEVALLALAGGAAAGGMPAAAILCLPILFAAGMSLLDTLDGALMRFAYGWAGARPGRKIHYNITVTGLSVAAALLVGSVELLSVASGRLGEAVDLTAVGYVVAGLFAAIWAASAAVWHLREDRA